MMELQGQEMETDFPLSKRKGLILLLALCLLFAGGAVFFSLRWLHLGFSSCCFY